MSDQPNPQADDDVNDALQNVHELGSATEQLFNRLYDGIERRTKLQQGQDAIALASQALDIARERSRQLRQLLRQKTDESARLHAIIGSVHEGIVVQDLEGRILLMNNAARDLLGSQKNFWNSELGTLFNQHSDITTLESELVPLDAPQNVEINGLILSTQLAAMADNSGVRMGTLILLRDVTYTARDERFKRSFVANISHELNTPLNVMRMASEMLNAQPEDAPANRRMLEMLTRNIDILDRMVRELFITSEMNAGTFKLERESINLETFIWVITDEFEEEMHANDLTLLVMVRDTARLLVDIDTERLSWALTHLIRNATHYTEAGGTVEVAAYVAEVDQEPMAVISVIDNGVGIREEDKPHIFNLFFRGQATNQAGKRLDPRGLGQGLYVARTVVEKHGGMIQVESKAGIGSHFRILLPLSSTSELMPQI